MVKRSKRIEKGIESIKKQLDSHFEKLEKDTKKGDEILSRYHIKEIEKSFLKDLEYRMRLIGNLDRPLLERYKKRLKEFKEITEK
ncbi:MAG: hypothetical protein WDZ62_02165 [Candidatus Pacearchaeota archaeon]